MSAILATEIVQSAFDKARNAVLNSSERIIETVFVGIPLLDLTVDECKALVVTINASLSKSDMRSWSTDSSKGYLYRGRCSNNGAAGKKGPLVINSRRSSKCGCKAAFVLNVQSCLVKFTNHDLDTQHHAECRVLEITEFQKKAHVFRGLQDPAEATEQLEFVTSLYTDDYSTRNNRVTHLINSRIGSLAMAHNDGVLPEGTSYCAPKAYTDSLIRASIKFPFSSDFILQ